MTWKNVDEGAGCVLVALAISLLMASCGGCIALDKYGPPWNPKPQTTGSVK